MSNWLPVIRNAHRKRRLPSVDDLIWLAIYTVLGSICVIVFIEGVW